MSKKTYYEQLGRIENITQGMELEEWRELTERLLIIRRLAKKHHRLAEMDCNGEGVIRGQRYYGGQIDEWAKREYGYSVKSAYVSEDQTIFDVESEKVQAKIEKLVSELGKEWKLEFQGDPRGNTVKLYKGDSWVDVNW